MVSVTPGAPTGAASKVQEDTFTYPEFYVAAESTASAGQHGFIRLEQIDLLLLLGGALFTTIAAYAPSQFKLWTFVVAAALLGVTTILKSANTILHADRDWADGRAAAESIKTLTWQYMMRAAPFDADDPAANAAFIDALRAILDTHPNVRHVGAKTPARIEQITIGMRHMRTLLLSERLRYYEEQRLGEQIVWYTAKAEKLRRAATRYFWIDLLARGAALVCAVLVIVLPDNRPSLAGLFSAVAAAATAWSQLGHNDELSKAYAATAQRLLLQQCMFDEQPDEQAFGRLVTETEEIIAREGAGWLSKRTK
jgi:hypothetical protein